MFTYSVINGALPSGLTLNSTTGVISGTPTLAGAFSVAILASNPAGCNSGWQYTLTVVQNCPTITLSSSPLADGTVNSPYSQTILASGGVAPYSYSVTNGSLPPGLSLNPTTGAISGVPGGTGTFGFTVTAADSNGCSGTQVYSIKVNSEPVVFNPPSDLRIDYIGANFVNLRWTDNSNSETGFVVIMCANKTCTNMVQVGQTGANATTYLVTQLLANTQYVFRVAAVNSAGQRTEFSNSVTVKTLRR